MTFEELEINISKLKLPYIECNLFSPGLVPGLFQRDGLYVCQNNNIWEIYVCERDLKIPKAIFYNENDLYEYVYCYYKKISDNNRFF